MRRVFAALALAGLALALTGSPALAREDGREFGRDYRIGISGGVVVDEGERITGPVVSVDGPARINGTVDNSVFVISGNARITGHVTGDVYAARGDVRVTGRVDGDILAIGGREIVERGALVRGDVISSDEPRVAERTVRGDVEHFDLGDIVRGFVAVLLFVLWLSVTASTALLGVLFVVLLPRAADAGTAAARRVWPSIAVGLVAGLAGPILAVIALTTVLGIPFGLTLFAALGALTPFGYITSALRLGRLMVNGDTTGARIGAFFAGFGILRALALLPGFGLLVWFGAAAYGLGALAIAAWRAGSGEPSGVGGDMTPATGNAP